MAALIQYVFVPGYPHGPIVTRLRFAIEDHLGIPMSPAELQYMMDAFQFVMQQIVVTGVPVPETVLWQSVLSNIGQAAAETWDLHG